MTTVTKLYLIIFPDRARLKIGKADDVHVRIQALKRWWGAADYQASYYLEAPLDVVFRLEKSLHFLLAHYAAPEDIGDGKSELFLVDALDIAIKHIDLYCSAIPGKYILSKGLSLPPVKASVSRLKAHRHLRLSRRVDVFASNAKAAVDQFQCINRLLVILLRKQTRIAYEYDITDSFIYFRLILEGAALRFAESGAMARYFQFNVHDFTRWTAINSSNMLREGSIVQFNFRRAGKEGSAEQQILYSYLVNQSEALLNSLPKRSAAAGGPIKILNEIEIFNQILGLEKE